MRLLPNDPFATATLWSYSFKYMEYFLLRGNIRDIRNSNINICNTRKKYP